MKDLGIRDIIGPVMIGPSSSHTAGALHIARLARKLLKGTPSEVTFHLYGSFACTYRGHGTDKALVAGILGLAPDDERIRDSFELARQAGMEFTFAPDADAPCDHPNTVDIEVTTPEDGTTRVRGESIGGGAAVISRINGIAVRLTGEYHSLVIKQRDVKGVLAHIASCLNDFNINIATTRLFRERKGEIAYTIMETDDVIPEEIARAIAANPDILAVRIIESDFGVPEEAEEDGTTTGTDGTTVTDPLAIPGSPIPDFESADFANGRELLALCEANGCSISQAMAEREEALAASRGIDADLSAYLTQVLEVMRASATAPLNEPKSSMGGLIGGEANRLADLEGDGPCDTMLSRAITYGMAVLETNASMGRIVAAPTAGSAGVLPAMLLSCQDLHGFSEEEMQRALLNAAAIGYIVTRNATVAGAEGGCQAEVGTASAMAASAAVELFGGAPAQCLAAASNALTGLMGLVCDPIAGLVEAPCQKRNATGVANAIVSAQIALAGIGNLVDFDQTVAAMYAVGRSLPFELRESALGGIAATPAACAFCTGCRG